MGPVISITGLYILPMPYKPLHIYYRRVQSKSICPCCQCSQADRDNTGAIGYLAFMLSFGEGSTFTPEFLKPKSLRCSQLGRPWSWSGDGRASEAGLELKKAGLAGRFPGLCRLPCTIRIE